MTLETCYVDFPAPLLPTRTGAGKWLLATALKAHDLGMQPLFHSHPARKVTLRVSLPEKTKIKLLGGLGPGVELPVYIGGLARAAIEAKTRQKQKTLPGQLRPEQEKLLSTITPHIAARKVIMAEAGTGVGKTMVGLILAMRHVIDTGGTAVYAVPTLAVLNDAIAEYGVITPTMAGIKAPLPGVSFLVGRQSLVSPGKLQHLLENPEQYTLGSPEDAIEARHWFDGGGGATAGARTAALHRRHPGLRWLAEDLVARAPGFPVHAVTVDADTPTDCEGVAQYQALKASLGLNRVIICTHSMLGLDAIIKTKRGVGLTEKLHNHRLDRYRDLEVASAKQKEKDSKFDKLDWVADALAKTEERIAGQMFDEGTGILPHYSLLVVDEAHKLEEQIATLKAAILNPVHLLRVITDKMSVFQEYRCKSKAMLLVNQLGLMVDRLHEMASATTQDRVFYRSEPKSPIDHMLSEAVGYVDKANITNLIKKCQPARYILESAATTLKNCQTPDKTPVWCSFSPVRRFPALQSGPQTVVKYLSRIWDAVDAAVLLSATLYVPGSSRNWLSCDLGVATSRLVELPPVMQPWLYDATLHEVGRDRPELRPPVDDLAAMDAWAGLVASEIAVIADRAVGGVLALTSSYDRLDCISRHLAPALGARLVVQTRDRGARGAQADFLALHRAKIKPVWLATGGAGTGVNITDAHVPAGQDTLLTDLVIISLPYGTNRTTTHEHRCNRNWLVERDRCAREFSQWIGRLIRRAGLRDRHIHILDPRVWPVKPGEYQRSAPFRRVIERYPRD